MKSHEPAWKRGAVMRFAVADGFFEQFARPLRPPLHVVGGRYVTEAREAARKMSTRPQLTMDPGRLEGVDAKPRDKGPEGSGDMEERELTGRAQKRDSCGVTPPRI